MKGAQVRLRGPSDQAYRRVTTDSDGAFLFNNVTAGSAMLVTSLKGYLGVTQELLIADGGRYLRQVALRRPASISGRVFDLNREPVSKVNLQLLSDGYDANNNRTLAAVNPRNIVRTDEQGRYDFTDLSPGDYYIRAAFTAEPAKRIIGLLVATTNNVATTYYPGVTSPDLALPVKVHSGENIASLDFAIEPLPSFKISGERL
jgi:hypothetical protein